MDEHIVVISGSAPIADAVRSAVPDDAIVLAADGGLDVALAAGMSPSGLIGDLDSISTDGLAWAKAHAAITRHDPDKDQTDTELALRFAAGMNPARLTLVGGGDRLDHTIAAIGALGAPELTSVPTLDAWWDGHHLTVVHGPGRAQLALEPGSRLSLLALHGPCTKVSIDGVRWPLDGVTLQPVVGWGVSNEVGDGDVTVSLSTGVLTVFDAPRSRPPALRPTEETSP